MLRLAFFFFFNDAATTEIYTLSLHDALPILDVGRRQNADPRWILPLLCRRGHITRNEIGAIRIGPSESHFQVPRAIADKFATALARTAGAEDGGDVVIERSAEPPAARPHHGAGKPHARPAGAGRKPPRAGNDARPRPPGAGKKP